MRQKSSLFDLPIRGPLGGLVALLATVLLVTLALRRMGILARFRGERARVQDLEEQGAKTRRANQVIGMRVRESQTGQQVGVVNDIAYSPERDLVVGLLLRDADRDALPFYAVQEITDAVIVRDRTALVDVDDAPEIQRAVQSPAKVLGLIVIDRDEDMIGTIDDTFFDEVTGRTAGFQVRRAEGGYRMGKRIGAPQGGEFFLPIDRVLRWEENRLRVEYSVPERDIFPEPRPTGQGEIEFPA